MSRLSVEASSDSNGRRILMNASASPFRVDKQKKQDEGVGCEGHRTQAKHVKITPSIAKKSMSQKERAPTYVCTHFSIRDGGRVLQRKKHICSPYT